jgi:hypothetical protein
MGMYFLSWEISYALTCFLFLSLNSITLLKGKTSHKKTRTKNHNKK